MPRIRERKADVERRRVERHAHRKLRIACGTVRASRCVLEAVREGVPLRTRMAGKTWALEVPDRKGVLLRRPTKEGIDAALEAARELLTLGTSECPPCDAPLTEAELERRRRTKVVVPQRPNGLPATYGLVDADELVASHVPTSFVPDPRYPEGVQERQYHADPSEQRKVVIGSQNLDPAILLTDTPSPLDGPPLVTEDGLALGGNGRSMMVKRAYALGLASATRYRDELLRRATEFGLRPADVERVTAPVLVRVLDGFSAESSKKTLSDAVRWFNEGLTQAMDAKAKAVAESRQLGDGELAALGELLASSDGSMRDLMREQPSDVVRVLESAGIVTPVNRSSWVVGGELTAEAKDRLEAMFLGRVLGSADRIRSTAPSLLAKVERAVPYLVRVAGVNPSLDLMPTVRAAVDLLNDARTRGLALDDLVNQGSLFGATTIDPRALALARLLDEGKPRAIGDRFKAWARTAAVDPAQPSMFWTPPTAEKTFAVLVGRVPNPFHAGDGGAAEPLGAMLWNRHTGHFGTGTYYVSRKEALQSGARAHRPIREDSFDGLKLYRPEDAARAEALHEALRRVNDSVHDYERPGLPPDALEREDLPDDYWERWLRQTDRIAAELERLGVHVGADELRALLQDAAEDFARRRLDTPSASTRVMVAAGFDGVDVTHLPDFDNTMYGSVVYGAPMSRTKNPMTDEEPIDYPKWTATYSNEEFDRAQGLAAELTERDRNAGRPAPKYGYTKENFAKAEKIVRAANRYSNPSIQRVPKVGDHVLYPGDVANQPARCRVTRVYEDRWGAWFDAVEEGGAGREFLGMALNSFTPGPLGGPAWTFRTENPSVGGVIASVKSAARHAKEIAAPLARGAKESAKVAGEKAKAKFCEACRKSCSERAKNPCSCRLRVKNPGELRVTVVRNNEGRSALALVRLDVKGSVKEFEAIGDPKPSSHEAAIASARAMAKKLHLEVEIDGVVEQGGREKNPSYAPIVRSRAKSTEALAAELRPRLKHKRAGALYVDGPAGLLRLELEGGTPKACTLNGRPRADVCKALRDDLAKSTTSGRARAQKAKS